MAQSSEKFVKFLQDALTHYLGFPARAANVRASFSEAGRWLTGARGGGALGVEDPRQPRRVRRLRPRGRAGRGRRPRPARSAGSHIHTLRYEDFDET